MLVLTRKENQQIIIDRHDVKIIINVVEIRGNQVRIGVSAPKHVPIHRKEIYDKLNK